MAKKLNTKEYSEDLSDRIKAQLKKANKVTNKFNKPVSKRSHFLSFGFHDRIKDEKE